MLTTHEWDELLHPVIGEEDKGKVRGIVARDARAYLSTLAPGINLTTTNLIDALYPREISEKTLRSNNARECLAKLLQKLAANELEDCCVKGEVNGQFMGHPKRPWIWFAPTRGVCPHCGQVMPEREDTQ